MRVECLQRFPIVGEQAEQPGQDSRRGGGRRRVIAREREFQVRRGQIWRLAEEHSLDVREFIEELLHPDERASGADAKLAVRGPDRDMTRLAEIAEDELVAFVVADSFLAEGMVHVEFIEGPGDGAARGSEIGIDSERSNVEVFVDFGFGHLGRVEGGAE